MANLEQLEILRQGVEVWNEWRQANEEGEIDLRGVDLSYANLSGADLRSAFLSDANLCGADLRSAILTSAKLGGAILRSANLSNASLGGAFLFKANLSSADLRGANLRGASLSSANLRRANLSSADLYGTDIFKADLFNVNLCSADLSETNLCSANLRSANLGGASLFEANLYEANLFEVNLRNANLSFANLRSANLSGADLCNADLRASQVLHADFRWATVTGACIADWQVGHSTNLNDVKCDYIFRTFDANKNEFTGRLPVDASSTFAPGEFTQRFQILASALETIDITFTKGIDWQAFFQSFQELKRDRPNENIAIQGLERKGDAFVVRLEVDAEADKAAIETQVKQLYSQQLAALEAQYEERLKLQSQEIAQYRQTQTSLLHIVQTMAEKDSITQNFNAPVGNVAGTNQGRQQNIQHIYAAPEKQDLAAAAAEIQRLLKVLEETNPTASEAEQKAFVTAAIPKTMRERAVNALQSGGQAALEEFLQNPYVNVALAIVEGWRED